MSFDLEHLELSEARARKNAAIELCEAGLLTCTRGNPGDDSATYALSWLPLDNPEQYSAEVRAKHAANMERHKNSAGPAGEKQLTGSLSPDHGSGSTAL